MIFHLQKLRIIFDNDEKNTVNVGAELLVYFNLLFKGFLNLRTLRNQKFIFRL